MSLKHFYNSEYLDSLKIGILGKNEESYFDKYFEHNSSFLKGEVVSYAFNYIANDNSDADVLNYYKSGDLGGYNIFINFKGNNWTSELQQAFVDASEFLSDTITGDIPNFWLIDDVYISASLNNIDGSGGVLGQAGAWLLRPSSSLPAAAFMQFDTADANDFNDAGTWDDIVLHEMLHSIGFSSNIWARLGLISGNWTDSPYFTGQNAKIAYEALFGADASLGVPLEEDGGIGTAYSHWDEEIFDNELMTGFINDDNYLSDMTIAALEDMGYDTVFDASDYVV